MASIADLIKGLKKLDDQSFRPGDSLAASTINHPLDALSQLGKYLAKQTNTAAGIPDQYDNPNPLLAPKGQEQAAFDLAGMAQLGSMPFAPKSAGGTLGSITAWHGSPHKFDKFDMSKIGTGEGAQAYGHGLYFAENPEIAEGYKKALSGGSYVDKRGMPVQPNEIASDIYEAARKGGADVQEASDASSFWSLYLRDGDKMSNSPGFKYIKDVIDGRGITFKDHGNLYKTSLEWPDPAREAADPLGPQHFLDWDKPLSEQPSKIRSALNNLAYENGDAYPMLSDAFQPFEAGSTKGSTIHSILSKRGLGESGNMPEAKDVLQKYGIPGIRYLDGGSRGAGEGSYNYVVFDDQIPKIVERNGQPLQSDNLNAGLIAKYLREGQLSPQELAQYETNAVQMTDSGKHHFNLANANAQGGTPESRAVDLGFKTDENLYRGTNANEYDVRNTGSYVSDDPEVASFHSTFGGDNGANVMPVFGHSDLIHNDNATPYWAGGNAYKLIPSTMRSRFAAFDPLRKDSANLLATRLLPATMLGYGMYNENKNRSLADLLGAQ